jgi:gas vesicle protein
MYYEKNSRAFNFIVGVVLGAAVGAGLAFLTAPRSGKRTRRHLVKAISGVKDNAGSRWDGLAGDFRTLISPGRQRVWR